MSVTVPPTRNEGDAGHIEDHNQISSDLAALSASVDGITAQLPGVKITVATIEPAAPAINDVWFDTSGAV
jgi:hypothetical protein